MLLEMTVNRIIRKLAAFVVASALIVGGAPAAMAANTMSDCGMTMGSTGMQIGMEQDAMGVPIQDQHQMACKDMAGVCTMTCGAMVGLPQISYLPVLTRKSVVVHWAIQAEFAGISSRPALPPPIAIL